MRSEEVIALTAVAIGLAGCGAERATATPQAVAAPAAAAGRSAAGLELATVSVSHDGRVSRFTTEVARSGGEQAQGLMFRTRVGPGEAMLFPMNPPRVAGFWMKNTLVPLDMIFVRADGRIARIARMTTPRSLATVTSGEPVAAVLEIAGGRSDALGISEGDRVSWPGGPAL